MTNMLLYVNKTLVDDTFANAPGNFELVEAGDNLIFSAGNATTVKDGEPIPSQIELNKAATLLSPSVATIVAKYFLADISVNLLKEIHLAGNGNYRYVFAASFDGDTATEPQLEVWDDINLSTYNLGCLGSGTPNNSWYKGVCTTLYSPGATWLGTPLAGSGISNIVGLNGGLPLGTLSSGFTSQELYFNFHVKIPAAYTTPGAYLPVMVVTYTTN